MDLTRLKFFIFFFIHKMAEGFETIHFIGWYLWHRARYLINFKKRTPTERISKKLFNRLLQLVPKKEDLSSIFSRDSEIEYYCTYYSLSPEAPTLRKTLKIYVL